MQGYGETALTKMNEAGGRAIPAASQDHSRARPGRNQPVMLTLSRRDDALAVQATKPPVSACAENPLAGFTL